MPKEKETAKTKEQEYKDKLHEYRKNTDKHVLVLEADLSEDDKRHLFSDANEVRMCGNKLTRIMKSRLEQLMRTKRYRNLQKLYGKAVVSDDDALKKKYSSQMTEMQKTYKVTWTDCRKEMEKLKNGTGVHSVFALTRAEDVWSGIEKVLYKDGKTLHFKSRGDLPIMRAKQRDRTIIITAGEGRLNFKYGDLAFTHKDCDRFQADEVSAILEYLSDPNGNDHKAVEAMLKHGKIIDTFRPCYAALECTIIRGHLRVFIHITVEGKAKPKYTRDGTRRQYGKGKIGADIGTQTVAYTSDSEVGLHNLAERGMSIRRSEKHERTILRAMDRSRRATNRNNYNKDGTIRKGTKKWVKSKRYRKLQQKHQELCRKNAINRKLAINEDVNHLRSLGDVFITEPKNAKKLQKKAKKPEDSKDALDKTGKPKRRKRFGKSIKNRCPGYFQERVKQVFEATGGKYIEVGNDYRASQYDHTADDYIKKKLSQRMFNLQDGTEVQRDWYSSFLLYCQDDKTGTINKKLCKKEFKKQHKKEQYMIENIKENHIKVMNSGIRIA